MKAKTETQKQKITKKFKKMQKRASKKNASFSLIELIFVIIFTAIITCSVTGIVVYKNYPKMTKEVPVSTNADDFKEFIEVYNKINEKYVGTVEKEELIDGAIEGMYNRLEDKYTTYMDESISNDLKEQLNGQYKGIGVEITKNEDGTILITKVFDNSSAKAAGLLEGDIITKIDNESVKDLQLADAALKIKSKASSLISYKRNNKEYEVTLKIGVVEIPSVTIENFNGIGYIYVSTFSLKTYGQFKEQLETLEKQKIKSLIIDLRGNTGGYLQVARDMSELFLEKGKNIYGLQDKSGKKEFVKDATTDSRKYKIVVLVNSASASASEILTSALKESYGAYVIGTTTYGKGTVQETESLSSGSMVKYTMAYWLTPNGDCINEIGIKPDKEVLLNTYDEYSYEVDNQLQEAIKYLK